MKKVKFVFFSVLALIFAAACTQDPAGPAVVPPNDPESVTTIQWNDNGTWKTLSTKGGADKKLNATDLDKLKASAFRINYTFSTVQPYVAGSKAVLYQGSNSIAEAKNTTAEYAEFGALGERTFTDAPLKIKFKSSNGKVSVGTDAAEEVATVPLTNDAGSVTTIEWKDGADWRALSDQGGADKTLNLVDLDKLKANEFRINYAFEAANPFIAANKAALYQGDTQLAEATSTTATQAVFAALGEKSFTNAALALRFKSTEGPVSAGIEAAGVDQSALTNDAGSVTTIEWKDGAAWKALSNQGGADKVLNQADLDKLKTNEFRINYAFEAANPFVAANKAAFYQGDTQLAEATSTTATQAVFAALGEKTLTDAALTLRFKSTEGPISAGIEAAGVDTTPLANDAGSVTTIEWKDGGTWKPLSNQGGEDKTLNLVDLDKLKANEFRINYAFEAAKPFIAANKAALYQGDTQLAEATSTTATQAVFAALGEKTFANSALTLRFKSTEGPISAGIEAAGVDTSALTNEAGSVTTIEWKDGAAWKPLSNKGGTDKVLNKYDHDLLETKEHRINYAFDAAKPFVAGNKAVLYQGGAQVAEATSTTSTQAVFAALGDESLADGALSLRFKSAYGPISAGIEAAGVDKTNLANDATAVTAIFVPKEIYSVIDTATKDDTVLTKPDVDLLKANNFNVLIQFSASHPGPRGLAALLYQGETLIAETQAQNHDDITIPFSKLGDKTLIRGALTLMFRDANGNVSAGIEAAQVRPNQTANGASSVTTIEWNDGGTWKPLSSRTGTDKALNRADIALLNANSFRINYAFSAANPLVSDTSAVLYQGSTRIGSATSANTSATRATFAKLTALYHDGNTAPPTFTDGDLTLKFVGGTGDPSPGIIAASVDVNAPTINSAETKDYNQGRIVVTLNEDVKALDESGALGFEIQRSAGSAAVTVSAVKATAKIVTLTLSGALNYSETGVKVKYTKPTGEGAGIEDLAGNPLENVEKDAAVQSGISLLSLAYDAVAISETKTYTASPKWDEQPASAVTYAVAPPTGLDLTGLTLDAASGELSIDSTKVKFGSYTVTATETRTSETKSATLAVNRPTPANRAALLALANAARNVSQTANLNYIDTSGVTDMSSLFAGTINTPSAFNGDISLWDVSAVTNMANMFLEARTFNGDLSKWNVSAVINMEAIFQGADVFNADISKWDVSAVTNMTSVFRGAEAFNRDISNWNVAKVTSMAYMFSEAKAFNQDISKWNVSNVTSMSGMFLQASVFNQDISRWDVSNVATMAGMFYQAPAFNKDISGWNVSKVTDMFGMFREAGAFNQDISGWDVSAVTNMIQMFKQAGAFNQDISGWDVSKVTSMAEMFQQAGAFNKDLKAWKDHLRSNAYVTNMFTGSGLASNPPCWFVNGALDLSSCTN